VECQTEGVVKDKKCIWVSNEKEDYKCQEVKESCEVIEREITCSFSGAAESDNGVLNCFWLYSKNWGSAGNCKEKSDSSLRCWEAKRMNQCTLSDVTNFGSNCIWVKNVCYKTENECEMITESSLCEIDGSVKSEKCIWLEGKTVSKTIKPCVSEVYFIFLHYFFLFCFHVFIFFYIVINIIIKLIKNDIFFLIV
jgi:hypothetical protein